MAKLRIAARLDIKGPSLIKGVHLEGLRVVGDPQQFSRRYYEDGIDEIIYIDAVASLYGRNNLTEIVKHTAKNVFVPITVGGGIRSLDDAHAILNVGADKIAINTQAIKTPEIITALSRRYGSQCVVLGIQAKRRVEGGWQCFTDNGREPTGLDVLEWAIKGAELGAGEILLTSVDMEGTRKGFDLDLIQQVSDAVTIPVIASGGFGTMDDFEKAVTTGCANAVAIADALHFDRMTTHKIRDEALRRGLNVRTLKPASPNEGDE